MKQVQKPRKPLIVYYLIAIAVLILFNSFVFPAIVGGNVEEVDYGTFLTMVENKEVSKVQLEGESIYFTDKSEDSRQYETTRFDDPDLVNRLEKAGCKFGRVADRQMSPFLSMLLSIVIPMIIFILLGQFLSRQLMKKMGGAAGGNQFMQFGKSNAKVYVQSTTGITFNDVAGEDEAKELLTEIVDFLHNPQKYQEIGAVCPKGALLVGPPGTGKKPPAHGRKAHSSAYLQDPLRNCGHSPWPERRPSGLLSCWLPPARRRWRAAGRWYQPPHRSGILPRSPCHLLK